MEKYWFQITLSFIINKLFSDKMVCAYTFIVYQSLINSDISIRIFKLGYQNVSYIAMKNKILL